MLVAQDANVPALMREHEADIGNSETAVLLFGFLLERT